jgi:hypothetical protein
MCDPDSTTFVAVDYSQWFDKWGSWDPYSTIMSEIDGDLDDLLTIFPLLFRENRRLKKIKFQHKLVDWEEHISMLEYTNARRHRCLRYCNRKREVPIPLGCNEQDVSSNKPFWDE